MERRKRDNKRYAYEKEEKAEIGEGKQMGEGRGKSKRGKMKSGREGGMMEREWRRGGGENDEGLRHSID